MEFQLQQSLNASEEIAKANYPKIRFILVNHSIQLSPQSDFQTRGWKVCDSNTVKDISAVVYFLRKKFITMNKFQLELFKAHLVEHLFNHG